MLKKHLKKFTQKKDICARIGCNNQIKREKNGTELNYCSTSCQRSHYSHGSEEKDEPLPYTTTSSNKWGVWTPNQEDSPPSYASISNDNDIFGSIDDVQVTPLWEADDDPPPRTSKKNSRYSSSSRPSDDFPPWVESSVNPLWTPPRNRNTSRNYSPPATPRASSSDEEEIQCPACTFFIRPNKTVCEMCGTSITRKERKKSYKSSSKAKPKSTITSYRDLYEEDEEEEKEEEDDNPFSDPPPRRNNKSSNLSSDDYRESSSRSRNKDNHRESSSRSRNQDNYRNSSQYYSSSDNDDNYGNSYSQSRNQSSRNRTSSDNNFSSYQTSTPPSDKLWIDEDEDLYESTPSRKTRQKPPPKNKTSSFLSYASDDDDDDDDDDNNYNYGNSSFKSRNQSSRRNRNNSSSYQTSTPPSDELWIDEDEDVLESTPSRKTTKQRAPPSRYRMPSFFKETESRPKRNVQRPPTPPSKDKQITCPACNFDNHHSMTHCEICYTQLNKAPEQRNTNPNRVEQQTRAKKACTSCSYYNDADSEQCEMCYLPMGPRKNFNLFNFLSRVADPDIIQCPTCTFLNHRTMVQCEMCRNTLPGGDLKQQQQQYQHILDNAPGPTTKLIRLPLENHDYMTVQQKFKVGVPNANILAVFKVIMPARIIQAHEAYKKQIAGNNAVVKVSHEMYHGTHVSCDAKRFYGPPGWKYCAAADCGLCGITQNGNSCARSKYGGRMWFANNSQTSLGYCRTDPIKAMFVQEIISATGGAIIIVDKEMATLVKFLIIFQ